MEFALGSKASSIQGEVAERELTLEPTDWVCVLNFTGTDHVLVAVPSAIGEHGQDYG